MKTMMMMMMDGSVGKRHDFAKKGHPRFWKSLFLFCLRLRSRPKQRKESDPQAIHDDDTLFLRTFSSCNRHKITVIRVFVRQGEPVIARGGM
jgi:hypothetical protein